MAEPITKRAGTLRLVLGDQLSDGLAGLKDIDAANDIVLLAEVNDEATYVRHHKQKIALIFAAMRSFAVRLQARGVAVRYVRIDDPANTHSIVGELHRALDESPCDRVVVTECGEWRLAEALAAFAGVGNTPVEIREDDRFICSHDRFRRWASGKSQLRMEFFYREMRRETDLLMDTGKPEAGRWNFDTENRRKLTKGLRPPKRLRIAPDPIAQQAIADVARLFPDHFGELAEFGWPTTAEQAEAVLAGFLADILPGFGDGRTPWLKASPGCGMA